MLYAPEFIILTDFYGNATSCLPYEKNFSLFLIFMVCMENFSIAWVTYKRQTWKLKDLHSPILNQKNQWCMELAKDEIILFLSTKIVKNEIDKPVLLFDGDLKTACKYKRSLQWCEAVLSINKKFGKDSILFGNNFFYTKG